MVVKVVGFGASLARDQIQSAPLNQCVTLGSLLTCKMGIIILTLRSCPEVERQSKTNVAQCPAQPTMGTSYQVAAQMMIMTMVTKTLHPICSSHHRRHRQHQQYHHIIFLCCDSSGPSSAMQEPGDQNTDKALCFKALSKVQFRERWRLKAKPLHSNRLV